VARAWEKAGHGATKEGIEGSRDRGIEGSRACATQSAIGNRNSAIDNSEFRLLHSRSALTLVEMLVVMVIITILISAVAVVATTLIERGKTNNTRAVLQNVSDALDAFRREQDAKPTITNARQPAKVGSGNVRYRDRYGPYPPDELEVFTDAGLPGSTSPPDRRSLAPGHAPVYPAPAGNNWRPMNFYPTGNLTIDILEHRDLAAMIIALETLSEEASVYVSRIPDRYRTPGVLDADGRPAMFLDRHGSDDWSDGDFQIRPIVDDWGVPLGYMSQRDWDAGGSAQQQVSRASNNHAGWNELSTKIIQLTGQPLIFSYGPNGKEQLTKDAMGGNGDASLPGDYLTGTTANSIDHHLNADNVYLDPTLAGRLARELD